MSKLWHRVFGADVDLKSLWLQLNTDAQRRSEQERSPFLTTRQKKRMEQQHGSL